MPYSLRTSTGTVSVPDNGVTEVAGITLPGKNYLGYGSIVDQTLLSMAENFASTLPPANPLVGQLWYEPATEIMSYYVDPGWVEITKSGGSANITSGNVTGLGNLSSANGTIGNLISPNASITGGNVTGLTNLASNNAAFANLTSGNGTIANLTSGNVTITGGNATGLTNLSATNLSATSGTIGSLNATTVVVTGNVTGGNINTSGQVVAGGTITGGNLATGGNLSVTGNGAISGNLAVVGNISGGNLSTAGNISGGNLSVTGNITGTLTNKITFNASGQGIAMGPGNTYDAASNIVVSWNTVGAASGNATGWANVGLGPVSNANVKITGGTAGQVLAATGTGDLDWVTPGTFTGGITTPGTITGGNLATGGNLSVTGNGAISGNLAVTGNISGGNISTAGNIAGGNISGNITGTLFNKATFNSSGTGAASPAVYEASTGVTVSWNTLGAASGNATGWANVGLGPVSNAFVQITGGTAGDVLATNGAGVLSWVTPGGSGVTTTSITTGSAATAGTITGAWTLTAGSKLEATYADLAERHHSDAEYPVGTVMTVGGVNEVTACPISVTPLGVISDQYAYLMNSEAGPDETHPAVGYLGRVPVRVIGPITKHQRIAPAGGGVATAADENSFGWALESNDEVGEKLVLCLIK
jgi:hypothetical protein